MLLAILSYLHYNLHMLHKRNKKEKLPYFICLNNVAISLISLMSDRTERRCVTTDYRAAEENVSSE